ncbi:radical SAM protein [uncultured Clostridium sp.]|uniref:B12-binding domain-containing radical SAM protein n=1 Tax=uncultured Clostridium sp. TaxID=59620 RepID=UPI0025D1EF07|nr:radical SAM protein [uncultured Clostridium sp.]
MCDVVLVFPPDYREVNEPCVNLPPLKAYLQSKGISVYQIDSNIEFYDYMSDKKGFSKLYDLCKNEFDKLNESEKLGAHEQFVYKDLCWIATSDKEKLIKIIEEAKNGLKDKTQFYSFNKYSENKKVMNSLMRAIGSLSALSKKNFSLESDEKIRSVLKENTPYHDYIKNVLLKEILDKSPKLVNVTIVAEGQLVPSILIAYYLKKFNIHVNISGYYITMLRDMFKTKDSIFNFLDSLVLFEEEMPLLKLVDFLISGKGDLENVDNLVYIKDGKVKFNKIGEPVLLDQLPVPDFDDLYFEKYFVPETAIPISTSRGCYWNKCKFCSFGKGVKKYDYRNAKLVAEDIAKIKEKYGTKIFLFFDVIVRPDYMVELADEIIDRGIEIYWTGVTRISEVFSKLNSEKIFKSGCRMLEFELESSREETHKEMNTGITLDKAKVCLKNTSDAGIVNSACLLYGLPGESYNTYKKTNDFIIENKDIINAIIAFTYNFTRNTVLWDEQKDYKLSLKENVFSVSYQDYNSQKGEDWKNREEGIFDLYSKTMKCYPSFFISYLPIIYYVKHYGISNSDNLVTKANVKEEMSKDLIPVLSNTKIVELNYDLLDLRKKFIYSRSGQTPFKLVDDINKSSEKIRYIFNMKKNIFVILDSKFDVIKKYINQGNKSIQQISEMFAKDYNINYNFAFVNVMGIIGKYKDVFDFNRPKEDSVKFAMKK